MSQIHNVNTSQVSLPQEQINTRSVEQLRNSRMGEVVQNVESGEVQPPRVHRSAAAIVGRVFLGIVTAGISEAVIAIVNKVHANSLERARQEALERSAAVTQFNKDVGKAVKKGSLDDLPEAHRSAVNEAFDALSKEYQDFFPPNSPKLSELISKNCGSDVTDVIKNFKEEVTPDQLKKLIMEKAPPHIRDAVIVARMKAEFDAVNMPDNAPAAIGRIWDMLEPSGPEMEEKYKTALDANALHQFIDETRQTLKDFAAFVKRKESIAADTIDKAVTSLSQQLKLTPEETRQFVNFGDLQGSLRDKVGMMGFGDDLDKLEQACQKKLTQFLDNKLTNLQTIQDLDISPTLKDIWTHEVISGRSINASNFSKALEQARNTPAGEIEALKAGLNDPKLDIHGLCDLLHAFAESVSKRLVEQEPELMNTNIVGPETPVRLCHSTIQAIMDADPELLAALKQHSGLLGQVSDNLERFDNPLVNLMTSAIARNAQEVFGHNEMLSNAVGSPESLPLPYAMALKDAQKAVRDAVGVELPDDMMAMKLASGRTVGEALSEEVKRTEGMISAGDLGKQAIALLCRSQDVTNAVKAAYGEVFDKEFLKTYSADIALVMASHNVKAGSEEAGKVIEGFKALQEGPQLVGQQYAAGRMAARIGDMTGLSEEVIAQNIAERKEDFKVETFEGDLNRWKSFALARLKDSSLPIATRDDVMAIYEARVDSVIEKRVDMHRAVENLQISPDARMQLHKGLLRLLHLDKPIFFEYADELAGKMDLGSLKRALQELSNDTALRAEEMDLGPLKRALQEHSNGPALRAEEMEGLLLSIGLQYYMAHLNVEGISPLDAEQKGFVLFATMLIAIDRAGGELREAFRSLPREFVEGMEEHLLTLYSKIVAELHADERDMDESLANTIALRGALVLWGHLQTMSAQQA